MNIGIIFPKDSEALFNNNSNRPYGGANIQLFEIAKEMIQHEDIKVFSLIVDYSVIQFPNKDDFNIVKIFKENDNFFKKSIKTHNAIRKNKINYIIQRGLTIQSCLMALYCFIFKIKFVFMFAHDIESLGRYQSNRKKCRFFILLLKFAYKLIVQNDSQYNNIWNKIDLRKISVIKKGLDLKKIQSFRKDMSKDFDCIWIARCDEWKNPEDFIKLAQKNKDSTFIMVAPPAIGKEEYYKGIIKLVRITHNIIHYDFIKNEKIYELLARTKVFCITSDLEGDWPMVVLEAAAVGVPILSLKINYDDLIDKYKGGIYCNADLNAMTRGFKSLVLDSELNKQMSENAVRYIYDNHDIVKNVKRLLLEIRS